MNLKSITLLLVISIIFFSCKTTHKTTSTVEKEIESTLVETVTNESNPQGDEFNIPYEKFTLDNGLEVILHEDHSDPIVAVATILHVGSNREKPGKTGFAHFFEHMAFNDSENVPVGANRKMIPEWGGQRNGGTWSDGTIYYEVVPKDAFDKILWIDSDRLGYMIKTVTAEALAREKQVVKNEKRQRVDNQAYGYTDEIIRKNLYPSDHPYSWTTIGQLPDLQAATIDDVKEFYNQYYGASNASLVIAGDIDIEETKKKVEQWFGEIRKGPAVPDLAPRPGKLDKIKNLYFEDNFAKLPELRIIFPTVEEYHEDGFALEVLGELLSSGRKTPLYNVVVEEQKLASNVSSYQSSSELAGTFVIRARANEGTDLDLVKKAIDKGLKDFEENGFPDSEMDRIKAGIETDLYQNIETILDKAFTLVQDNEFNGNPTYVIESAKKTLAVTREDVMRVYNKYIKGKNYLMTSFVPKGQLDLRVENSEKAEVWIEEVKEGAANEEVSQGEEAVYEKTVTKFDRSEPPFGKAPLFKMPKVWKSKMANGIGVYGIGNYEIPIVNFNITIDGGHYLDPLDKPGVCKLLSDMMMEGTASKTAAELEEAIGLLGASINVSSGNEEITISASCLSKNFEKTLALVEEILLEPNWNNENLEKLRQELRTTIKGREARATSIAFNNISKMLFGKDHIMSTSSLGNLESVEKITMEDLKSYYMKLSPRKSNFHIVGAIDQRRVTSALKGLEKKWSFDTEAITPTYQLPSENIHAGKIYFIDVPGSKQSTIFLGKLTIPASHPDYKKMRFANEVLGRGSSGMLTQILRIEKGYTYGASSMLRANKISSPFMAYSSVRANATLPSLEIIEDLIGNYGNNFSQKDADITKNKILKDNTRAFESLNSKLSILRNISKYGKSLNYLEEEQETLLNMDVNDFKDIIKNYFNEKEMVYIIVGDAETQLSEVNKLGKGDAIMIDIYGNKVK